MIHKDKIPKDLLPLIEEKLQGSDMDIEVPPAVFIAMRGEFIEFDVENSVLECRFPVLQEQLNPYGNMQGGIISAAMDNTIGPLSMLVSPPNFTRHMEVKYLKVVPHDLQYIHVTAMLVERKKRQLFFEAEVKNDKGEILASAKSRHWVIL